MRKFPIHEVMATLPPYVSHRPLIIGHPLVGALRLNTVSPLAETPRELLARLQRECGPKPLWIDLKSRQLRISKFAYLPFAFVELDHNIHVDLPCPIYFKDCLSTVVRIVNGRQLILDQRPARVVGEGEPVNILDPSLQIDGVLTDRDRTYVEAAKQLGLHDYLLSFVESASDLQALRELDPQARIIVKIESRRGLKYVHQRWRHGAPSQNDTLMAARDDLYIQMTGQEAEFLPALESIVHADPEAIVASRLLTSFEEHDQLSSQDLCDLALMFELGYRRLMLSDRLCFQQESFRAAITALDSLITIKPSRKRAKS